MLKSHPKKYNWFINAMWLSLAGIFWIQFSASLTIIQAGLFAGGTILVTYPFTTHLSRTLLSRAMADGNKGRFIQEFILYTLCMATLLCSLLWLFTYLENMEIFPPSVIFSGEDTFISDALSGFSTSLFINLGFCGLQFYAENLRLQKVLAESQLQILQNQVNPHFMFNILNHIYVLMETDVALASDLLLRYSDVLRYQLYSGKKERISLEEEITFLRNYIEVEKIRWQNKLQVKCLWEIENGKQLIPPLLFITFVENAFKHVSRTNSEKGYIGIEFIQQGNRIELQLNNSKSLITAAGKKEGGIGLENIRKRLDILLPGKYDLQINESEQEYISILTLIV